MHALIQMSVMQNQFYILLMKFKVEMNPYFFTVLVRCKYLLLDS